MLFVFVVSSKRVRRERSVLRASRRLLPAGRLLVGEAPGQLRHKGSECMGGSWAWDMSPGVPVRGLPMAYLPLWPMGMLE